MFDPDDYSSYELPEKPQQKIKAHQPYVPPPRAQSKDFAKVAEIIKNINEVVRFRRKVLLPSESFNDYIEKLHKSGMRREEFDKKRLIQNGWTEADEASLQRHFNNLPWIMWRR